MKTDEEIDQFLGENPRFLENWLLQRLKKDRNFDENELNQNGLQQDEDQDLFEDPLIAQLDRILVQIKKSKRRSKNDHQNGKSSNLSTSKNEISNLRDENKKVEKDSESSDDELSEREAAARSVVPRTARKSVTSDLFHQWLANKSPNLNLRSSHSSILANLPNSSSTILEENSPLASNKNLENRDLLLELILDISNELNIEILCAKISENVRRISSAEKCSLLLAKGPRDARYLISKRPSSKDAVEGANEKPKFIPFGEGVCGRVAESKAVVVVDDGDSDRSVYHEFEYSKEENLPFSLVCLPVCNFDGEVIAVARVENKKTPAAASEEKFENFNNSDIKMIERYLTFCGIGIQKAQLFDVSILEYKKNQLLLSLAKSLFQEQMSLEGLVSTIIKQAKEMLNCERCTVYLLDLKAYNAMESELFHFGPKVGGGGGGSVQSPRPSTNSGGDQSSVGGTEFGFDQVDGGSRTDSPAPALKSTAELIQESAQQISFHQAWERQGETLLSYSQGDEGMRDSRRARIAKYVAFTQEVLNLNHVANWLGETVHFEEKDGFVPRSMVCIPIFNKQNVVIGVAQLINKLDDQNFNESDIRLFEAFAIFCGIGIHNTKVYEGACKLMAKQKVALDCLSYHASASEGDTDVLVKSRIPSTETFNLYSYKFDDSNLPDEETYKIVIRMFLDFDLINNFNIPYRVLCQWILSVKKNYRPVKYHNWRHALNVCQTMFTVLKTGKMERFMDELEILGLLVACLSHDLDHRGTNNAFQTKMDSPLAILYSTSTMEHHHFDQCVMILSSEGNNIFQGMSTEHYRRVMKVVEEAILSTDLALYFRKKDLFLETANSGEIDWQGDKKSLLTGMLMTACDVASIAKPWELQHKMAKKVADEFFDQGDMEKMQLNIQPIAMMDRERKDELPKMQVDFIDYVCRPLYGSLSESFPWIKPLLDGCLANREHWIDLNEKVKMGLTWIDHDVIEKPVEEFSAGTADADIEFKVETLGNVNGSVIPSNSGGFKAESNHKESSSGGGGGGFNSENGGLSSSLSNSGDHKGHHHSVTHHHGGEGSEKASASRKESVGSKKSSRTQKSPGRATSFFSRKLSTRSRKFSQKSSAAITSMSPPGLKDLFGSPESSTSNTSASGSSTNKFSGGGSHHHPGSTFVQKRISEFEEQQPRYDVTSAAIIGGGGIGPSLDSASRISKFKTDHKHSKSVEEHDNNTVAASH